MRMQKLIGAALIALALAPAFAQEADPFAPGAFEAEAGTSASQPEGASAALDAPAGSAARTEYLVGGAALISANASIPAGLGGYAAGAGASGKVFAKVSVPDYGSLYISYGLSQAFFEGRTGSGVAALAPPLDLSRPSYYLTELHYSFDIGKVLFARLGKQLIAWGPSRIWSPIDFVNSQKADAFSPLDLRQGKSGLRLHLPLGKANAFAFADFSGTVAGGAVLDPIDAVSLAARLDATLGGFELGLSGFGAAHEQAKLGADFSGHFLGSAVYGEAALAPAYSSYGASVMASLGLSRALGDLKRWTVSGEGFYSSSGADLSGSPALAAATPLYSGEFYGYAALAAKEFLSPCLGSTLSVLANLSDLSYTVKLAESLAFPRSVPVAISLAYAGGGSGKEFTFLGGDGSLSLSIQTRFEF
jgi:hypothetical protein